jgi:hypothetical protein
MFSVVSLISGAHMKFSNRQIPNLAAKASLYSLNGIALAASLLVVTDASAQTTPPGSQQEVTLESSGAQKARTYVTSNAEGLVVALDRQTGQMRPLTSAEAQKLAEGIKDMVSQSTEGLVQVRRADGTVSMDLQGRFQSVLLARKEADGSIVQGCVDNLETAAAFFDIDPALVGTLKRAASRPASTQLELR